MAKINDIIPFILHFEAGVKPSLLTLAPSQIFMIARRTGFANDPDDVGGATMCGVTMATFKNYCKKMGYPVPTVERLKNISYADWKAILKTMYWDRWKADDIKNQALANILVDWVWASGAWGIKNPQKILGVVADGIVGPKTLGALNAADPEKLFNEIHRARISFVENIVYRNPSQGKFLRGWERRINAITFNGIKI